MNIAHFRYVIVCIIFLLNLGINYVFADNSSTYSHFSNNINTDAPLQVNCFATDKFGQLWYGSHTGIYSFDGYSSQQHTTYKGEVYSIFFDDNKLWAGTDYGLLYLNLLSGEQKNVRTDLGTVRSLKKYGNTLYVGSQYGLFVVSDNQIDEVTPQNGTLTNPTIYSLECVNDTLLYIGTYNGLCCYSPQKNIIQTIELPNNQNKPNVFINSLLFDKNKQQLYIGTEGELFVLSHSKVEKIKTLSGNSIKSLQFDSQQNLLIGTDNGLYILNEQQQLRHLIHDVWNNASIAGNNIWSIYSSDDNVWFGTDNGISYTTSRNNFINISDITHTTQGNTITTILADKKGYLWLGGTNGLIRTNKQFSESVWYSQSSEQNTIPHNHIRRIYEDADGDLWIASDGGLLRYNYENEKFISYNIVDSANKYNANWVYDIHLMPNKKLWIATCRGGIMVVDKSNLLSSELQHVNCIAQENYNTSDGLSSDFALRFLQADSTGVIVKMNNDSTFLISNNIVTSVQCQQLEQELIPTYCDSSNFYIGGVDGVFCATHTDLSKQRDKYLTQISDILINGKSIWGDFDIRFTDKIEVSENNKDITIVISNYNYYNTNNTIYAYRIEQLDEQWHYLPKGDNKLHIANLSHGTYTIYVGTELLGNIHHNSSAFTIVVLPPWYQTWWALLLYVVIFLFLIIAIISVLHIRHNIELERQERESALEQAHIKLNFFSQLSADLKGPLSQIIGRLNAILSKTTDTEQRTNIATILTNARQLNQMISQAFFTDDDFEQSEKIDNEPVKIITETQDERFMSQVMSVIDENIDNADFNVNALADKLCMSQKQLYRRIKTITNQTPIEYISGIRMKKAALLLSQGSFTVAEVMYMVGHTNHSYFAKCFATAYGMPPKMYAQQQKELKK